MTADTANSGPSVLDQARREGINVFGAGGFAKSVASAAVAKGIVVHTLLTSHEPVEHNWNGIPIHRVEAEWLARAPTWVAVFNREPHSDYSCLRSTLEGHVAANRVVWPQTFYEHLEDLLGWRFWLHRLSEYDAWEREIDTARSLLEDSKSRSAFDSVLSFRRAATDWCSPVPSSETQYMPSWFRQKIKQPLRIVDGGAYRGETLLELAALVTVEQAWSFEPDTTNFAELAKNSRGVAPKLTLIPAGLSDQTATASFAAGNGEGSSFTLGEGIQVPVVAVDDCLQGAGINFLKLDVEGHELHALRGAVKTLRRDRPALAIAGYHRWNDLWEIPRVIANLKLDYKLRMELHGHNSFDSVFYAY